MKYTSLSVGGNFAIEGGVETGTTHRHGNTRGGGWIILKQTCREQKGTKVTEREMTIFLWLFRGFRRIFHMSSTVKRGIVPRTDRSRFGLVFSTLVGTGRRNRATSKLACRACVVRDPPMMLLGEQGFLYCETTLPPRILQPVHTLIAPGW